MMESRMEVRLADGSGEARHFLQCALCGLQHQDHQDQQDQDATEISGSETMTSERTGRHICPHCMIMRKQPQSQDGFMAKQNFWNWNWNWNSSWSYNSAPRVTRRPEPESRNTETKASNESVEGIVGVGPRRKFRCEETGCQLLLESEGELRLHVFQTHGAFDNHHKVKRGEMCAFCKEGEGKVYESRAYLLIHQYFTHGLPLEFSRDRVTTSIPNPNPLLKIGYDYDDDDDKGKEEEKSQTPTPTPKKLVKIVEEKEEKPDPRCPRRLEVRIEKLSTLTRVPTPTPTPTPTPKPAADVTSSARVLSTSSPERPAMQMEMEGTSQGQDPNPGENSATGNKNTKRRDSNDFSGEAVNLFSSRSTSKSSKVVLKRKSTPYSGRDGSESETDDDWVYERKKKRKRKKSKDKDKKDKEKVCIKGKDKPYECRTCGAKFSLLRSRTRHEREQHGEELPKFACTFPNCGRRFHHEREFNDHVRNKHTNEKYRCGLCPGAYSHKSSLMSHISYRHEDPSTWKFHCELCDIRIATADQFAKHRKKKGHRAKEQEALQRQRQRQSTSVNK